MTISNTAATTALLRLEVGRLRQRESRQRFDTVVGAGRLGGARSTRTVPRADQPLLDAGTRTDVVARLLEEVSTPRGTEVWITRAGEPLLQDEDLAWLSASVRACGALGVRLEGFWTVTRTGWLDVRTGESRTWRRLRL